MLNNTIKMQSAKCGKFYRINNRISSTNKRYDDVGLRGRQIQKKKKKPPKHTANKGNM